MRYLLLDYVCEKGWPELSKEEQTHWLTAYRSYMQAMTQAGVLLNSTGLQQTFAASTVRIVDGQPLIMDGPYAETKEQIGGFHLIEVPDLRAAQEWAAKSPTALHGIVEVRPVMDGTFLTKDISEFIAQD